MPRDDSLAWATLIIGSIVAVLVILLVT